MSPPMSDAHTTYAYLILTLMVLAGIGTVAICDRLEDIARAIRDEKERKHHA